MIVASFKMPWPSRQFHANQRVWIIRLGDFPDYRVIGKFRGSGRYVEGWVHTNKSSKPAERIVLEFFDVDEGFAARHGIREQVIPTNQAGGQP